MADDPAGTGETPLDEIRAEQERQRAEQERQRAEQERQGGILTQILDRLPGKTPSSGQAGDPGPDEGKTVAELVRDGVAELEAKKAKDERRAKRDQEAADQAARIKALEERQPTEVAATPAGRFRSWTQKRVFGIDDPRK